MNKRIREKVSKRHDIDGVDTGHSPMPVGQAVVELRASALNLAQALLADIQGRFDGAFSRVWVKLAPLSADREPAAQAAKHTSMVTPDRSQS